jgi:pimeloyl-ACP methyl ester carboxylesterase
VVGSGERTILALHGFGASLDTWKEIEPFLAPHFRVIMPDLLGFGLSAHPRGFGYTAQEQTQALAALIEFVHSEFGGRSITLVGHSLGGALALAVYLEFQHRDRHLIDSLVLIDAVGFPQDIRFPLYLSFLRIPVLNRLVLNLFPGTFRSYVVIKHLFLRSEFVDIERVCRYAQFNDVPGGHDALIRTWRQLGNRKDVDAFTARIPGVAAPTLIIWGDRDELVPKAQAERLRSTISTSLPVAFLKAGHLPHEELPAATAELMREFLARMDGSSVFTGPHLLP